MKYVKWISSEIILGSLIAILSVMTALSSFQGAMADSDQNKHEILGIQTLTDANAEYLTANQNIIQDYNNYDIWYVNFDTNQPLAEYYEVNFSDPLVASMQRDEEYPFDDQYYEEMYQLPNELFADADEYFSLGSAWDERGDKLQLVMLIMALGLAFAAWASLLKEDSKMRLLFAIFSIITLVGGLITYLGVPSVS